MGGGFAVELECVGEEVLEELGEHGGVAFDRGQRGGFDGGAGVLDGESEGVADLRDELGAIDGGEGELAAHAGVGEQVLDEFLHALGSVDGIGDELVGFGVEFLPVAL